MRSTMRWLPFTSLLFLLCAPMTRVQAQSKPPVQNHSHQSASRRSTSHPSHPMRNVRPKHHAMASRVTPLLAVRYLQPQQASAASSKSSSESSGSSDASSKSSGHSSTASSSKKKSSKKSHHARREPSQKAPTPERISEIQSSLARGGYYQGDPNGKWDANTVAAMQKFQSANGLDPSGKLDASSLQKLGLGSGIAGVSAPKPPTAIPSAPAKPIAAQPSATSTSSASNSASNSSPATSSASDPKPQQR
jgi:hypothetical protein